MLARTSSSLGKAIQAGATVSWATANPPTLGTTRSRHRPGLAERRDGLLHRQQLGRLAGLDVARSNRADRDRGGRRIVRRFHRQDAVVLTKTVVVADQVAAELLGPGIEGGTTILRVLDVGCPGVR